MRRKMLCSRFDDNRLFLSGGRFFGPFVFSLKERSDGKKQKG